MAVIAVTAMAGNKISLSSASGHPGDEVTVTASLGNDDAITAIEVLVPLNDHVQYVPESATLNTERGADHTMTAAVVDGTLRVYIYSLTLSPIAGNDGELFSFRLSLGKEPADYVLTPQVILGDASGASLTTEVQSGTLTILSPKLTITTTSIAWGRVAIRSSYNKTLTFKNSGNEPLIVSGFEFGNCDFTTSTDPIEVAPGASKSVTVKYSPMERGTISDMVTIHSNAINGDQTAQLTATPYSVNELHVLRTSGVSDEEVTVALRLKNMEPIVAMQCEFTMPEQLKFVEGSFEVNKNRCSNHQALATLVDKKLTLYVYSPTNAAVEEGNDTIATFKVRLDGTNGSYYLKPANVILSNITEENMTSATSQNYVTIKSPKLQSDAAVDMGLNPVTETAVKSYSIYNSGQVDLTVERVTFLAEGYRIVEELPMTVGVKETKTLTIEYAPTVQGQHTTTMQVYTNDPLNRMKSVAVSGDIFEPNYIAVTGNDMADKKGYSLSVALDNYTDIVALQMDIHWIEGMTTAQDSIVLADRLAAHSAIVTKMSDTDWRVVIYSMTNTAIDLHEGELFTLGFANSGNIDYYESVITVDNIVMSTANGINAASADALEFFVKDMSTSVETLIMSDAKLSCYGNRIEITNLSWPSNVAVFTIKGEKVAEGLSVMGEIAFENLASGFYIIIVNDNAFKVKL